MRITFLLPNNKIVESPYDIPAQYYEKFSFNTLIRLKALGYNKKFVSDINSIRKHRNINIDENKNKILLPFRKLLSISIKKTSESTNIGALYSQIIPVSLTTILKIGIEELRIYLENRLSYLKTLQTYQFTDEFRYALTEILLFETIIVKPPTTTHPPIYWTDLSGYEPHDYVRLNIRADVYKQNIIDFVDHTYDKEIKPQLKIRKAPKKDDFELAERDLYILDLRLNKKKKFTDIEDLVDKKFRKGDNPVAHDTVKMAFHRAKKKVDSL